jgi:pimeloyl-ACP methyl ester carboxylesterase
VAGEASRDTILITRQFLTAKDIAAHGLANAVLRWRKNDWQQGKASADPVALGSFEVVDEIFRRLAERSIFPNLKTIVLVGHSAGGQLVQRYAAIGRGDAGMEHLKIHVRYLVANPASYFYLTSDRPGATGAFHPFDAGSCPGFDHWPYGLNPGVPSYGTGLQSKQARAAYLRQDIVYLLGTSDNAPDADGMDHSCGAEAQGATRYARGLAYNAYVHLLDPQTRQHVLEVPGIAHLSYPMLSSACGLFALFDKAGACG